MEDQLLPTTRMPNCSKKNSKKYILLSGGYIFISTLCLLGAAFNGPLGCASADKIIFPGFEDITPVCPDQTSFTDLLRFYDPRILSSRQGVSIYFSVLMNAFIAFTCIYKVLEDLSQAEMQSDDVQEHTSLKRFCAHYKKPLIIGFALAGVVAHGYLAYATQYQSSAMWVINLLCTVISYFVQNYLSFKYLFEPPHLKEYKNNYSRVAGIGFHLFAQVTNVATVTGYLIAPIKGIAFDIMPRNTASETAISYFVTGLIATFTDLPFVALAMRFCFNLIHDLHWICTNTHSIKKDYKHLNHFNKILIPLVLLSFAFANWFSVAPTFGLNHIYCTSTSFCEFVNGDVGRSFAQLSTWMFNFYASSLLIAEWAFPSFRPENRGNSEGTSSPVNSHALSTATP